MSGIMKGKPKEYELVIDYSAFMVAIVLVRHEVSVKNIKDQWSAEMLAASLNTLQYSDTPNLRIHSLALKHGMQIFRQCISKRGHTAVLMLHQDKGPSEYFTLEASARSTEVIFASLNSPLVTESQESLMSRVVVIRDDLMMKRNYCVSSHHTASSVFAALYLPLITEIETPIVDVSENSTPRSQLLTRKSPSKLSHRAIQNSADKIIANTELLYGKKHATFYLESALKKKKQKINHGVNEEDNNNNNSNYNNSNSNSDEENNQIGANRDFMDDERVINILSSIPDKYVIFSEEDQQKVISLYGVIREVAIERDHKCVNKVAATATVKILQSCKYYSQISTRTIMRWYELKDITNQRTGHKVDEIFESEVWGNFMLCVFNKKNNQVNVYLTVMLLICVLYVLSLYLLCTYTLRVMKKKFAYL